MKAKSSIKCMFIGWILTSRAVVCIINANPSSNYMVYQKEKRAFAMKKILNYWLKIHWNRLVYNYLLRKKMMIKACAFTNICTQCYSYANQMRQKRSHNRHDAMILAYDIKKIRCYIIYIFLSLILMLRAFVQTKINIYLNNMANKIKGKCRWHMLSLWQRNERCVLFDHV